MEQGVLAAAPPVCASEDYMMRKPPHQRNRGDSNCKESLSARSYYIKRIYQRGNFFNLPCFYIVLPFSNCVANHKAGKPYLDCPRGLGYGNSETLSECYLHLAPVARQQ